jgi:hypothetical protein
MVDTHTCGQHPRRETHMVSLFTSASLFGNVTDLRQTLRQSKKYGIKKYDQANAPPNPPALDKSSISFPVVPGDDLRCFRVRYVVASKLKANAIP